MQVTPQDLVAAYEYVKLIPSEAASGDVFAISAVLITAYLTVCIINKLTGFIIFLVKKLFLLTIVSTAFYQFMKSLVQKISAHGLTNDTIVFGLAGTVLGFLAFIIALYAALASFKKVKSNQEQVKTTDEHAKPEPLQLGLKDMFSVKALKDDKHAGAVLSYMVIAQFGVFSSKTISAPNPIVGLLFFAVFMLAAFYFVNQTYQDTNKGLHHLSMVCVGGAALSVILGNLWNSIPIAQLLSPAYFATESLVAYVTGIAVSLFMSGKG